MNSFEADYFDGLSARGHSVQLSIREGVLNWVSDTVSGSAPLTQLRWDPAVGQTHAIIHLNDGGMFLVHDRALGAHWPHAAGVGLERWAQVLEGRMLYALGALLMAGALVFSGLRWGVPAAAQVVAGMLPEQMAQIVGDQTLKVLEGMWLAPSQLPETRQHALAQQLDALCKRASCPPYQLLFRQGQRIGANAMALPGGAVVVTDELVLLARHDEEIVAVLSHELGHVHARHGLRMALQSLGAGVILVAITGDLGNVSDVAAGLPALLLQTGYSRGMEREADDFALHWLRTACVSPQRFADILQRLDKRPTETGLFDSHPGTAERIRQFSQASSC
ncbi:hypothetical protein B9Z51_16260 [Limnohabitans sp. T6-5]|uniref:M48 family metallopeptidase n=1 Tax=Limnohabitans sp. T6-5 TaxID=1100724 RepID=UPI000D3C433C|nr:M48 family metallopeptidase [Limnohabitans sp. T6-5]PUE06367.1 hypothetical protein B9Z51_16260 [Limnohabitans sp. T6-5]